MFSDILNMLLDLDAEGELSSDTFEQKILDEICSVYAIEPLKNFNDLHASVVREIKIIQDYKNLSIFLDYFNFSHYRSVQIVEVFEWVDGVNRTNFVENFLFERIGR